MERVMGDYQMTAKIIRVTCAGCYTFLSIARATKREAVQIAIDEHGWVRADHAHRARIVCQECDERANPAKAKKRMIAEHEQELAALRACDPRELF